MLILITYQCLKIDKNQIQFDKLISWLSKDIQFKAQKVIMKSLTDNNRIIVASENIEADEEVMFIPNGFVIHQIDAYDNPNNFFIKLKYPLDKSEFHMTLLVLWESQNHNSKWQTYFDSIVQDFDTFPLFYNQDDQILLKGSNFKHQLDLKQLELQFYYQKLCQAQPNFYKYFSIEQFYKAYLTIRSRSFNIYKEEKQSHCLIPLADYMNHDESQASLIGQWNNYKNGISFYAPQPIQKGQQLTYNYHNDKSKSFMLENYGFINKQIKYDDVFIFNKLDENSNLFFQKSQITLFQQLIFRVKNNITNSQFKNVLGFNRFSEIKTQQELNLFTQQFEFIDEIDQFQLVKPLTLENEKNTLQRIQIICADHYRSYPTNIKQDQENLQIEDLTQKQKDILNLLLSEKITLHYYLIFTRDILDLIKKLPLVKYYNYTKDIEIIKKSQIYQKYQTYIDDVIILLSLNQ